MFLSHRKRTPALAKAGQKASRRRLLVESLEERRVFDVNGMFLEPQDNAVSPSDTLVIDVSLSISPDHVHESFTGKWSLYLDNGVAYDLLNVDLDEDGQLDRLVYFGEGNGQLDTSVAVLPEPGENDVRKVDELVETADSSYFQSFPISIDPDSVIADEGYPIQAFSIPASAILNLIGDSSTGDRIDFVAVLTLDFGGETQTEAIAFQINLLPNGEGLSPVIDNAGITGPSTAVAGQTVTYSVGFTDADSTAAQLTHTWTIIDIDAPYVNGEPVVIEDALVSVSNVDGVSTATFIAPYNGNFSVDYSVMDQTGLSASATSVPLSVGNISLVNGVLSVAAQPGGSTVVINNSNGSTSVNYDGTSNSFDASLVNSIVVYGNDGSDVIVVAGNVTKPVTILAGEGNDIINGGSGSDVLVGGLGADIIIGGAGADLIIGGDGADLLLGNGGDDILIAGYTNFDGQAVKLNELIALWNSLSASTRIASVIGAGLNSSNVFDDNDLDLLTGNAGVDWYFANLILDGTSQDRRDMVLGRASGENVLELA